MKLRGESVTDHDPLPDAARSDRLDAAIADALANGGRLDTRYPHHAVIRYGAGNVLMHLTFAVLTYFTGGLFVFPWIVWANTIREHRVRLDVDPDGRVIRRR